MVSVYWRWLGVFVFVFLWAYDSNFAQQKKSRHSPSDTTLSPDQSIHLDSVVLHAQKKSVVKQQIDKIFFQPNMQVKAGKSVTDLFAKTPMVSYRQVGDNGEPEVNIIDKTSTEIFINGKRSFLDKEALLSILQTQPAESVEKIEVIYNPKLSEDVARGGGVINIVFKENIAQGWSGEGRVSGKQNHMTAGNMGGSVRYEAKKWHIDASLTAGTRAALIVSAAENIFAEHAQTQRVNMTSRTRNVFMVGNRTIVTYNFNKRHSLSIGGGGFTTRRNINTTNENTFHRTQTGYPIASFFVHNESYRLFTVAGTGADYSFKPNSRGSEYKASIRFIQFQFGNGTSLQTQSPTQRQRVEQSIVAPTKNFRFNSSYNHVINSKLSVESGFGYNWEWANTKFMRSSNDRTSQGFLYTKQSYTGFSSYSVSISDKFQTMMGLHLQYLIQQGHTPLFAPFRRDFLFLLPTVSVLYIPHKKHSFTFALNRHAQAPQVRDINPFRIQQSNNTYRAGNENLRVPTHYESSILYTFAHAYTLSVRYTFDQDAYTRVNILNHGPEDRRQNAIVSIPYNYGNAQTWFCSLSGLQTFLNGYWQIQATLTSSYAHYKGQIPGTAIDRGGFGGQISVSNTINLSGSAEKNKWIANVDFHATAPSFHLYGFTYTGPNLSIGLKKIYKQLVFAITASDLTGSARLVSQTIINGLYTHSQVYKDLRTVDVSVSYRLGKNNTKILSPKRNGTKRSPPIPDQEDAAGMKDEE